MSGSPTFVGYELLDRAGMIDSNDDRLISTSLILAVGSILYLDT